MRRPARVRPLGLAAVDALVLVVVLAVVLYPLLDVYGGAVAAPAIAGGLLVGGGLGLVAAWRTWSALSVVAAVVGAYVVLGGPLAVPTTTVAGVVPTGETLVALARGVVSSWSQVVTLQPPVGRGGSVLVAAFVLALAGSSGAVALATRLRAPAASAAALVPVAVLVVVILLGTRAPTVPPVATGVVLAVVLLGWAAWRADRLRARRVVATSVVAVVAVGSGVLGASAVVADQPRYVLRDEIVPPFDPRDYASPLSAFREYLKELDETTLFTVSGLPEGARVRLATMDAYDGVVWNVAGDGGAQSSGEFRRVGGELATSLRGTPAHVDVTVEDLGGVWLPTVGQTTAFAMSSNAVTQQLRFNEATGAAVLTGGLTKGLSYGLDVVVPAVPADDDIGAAEPGSDPQPVALAVPDVVGVTAADVARDAGNPVEVARELSDWLVDEGFYSDGLDEQGGGTGSLSGHGADRIASLLGGDQLVGDGEQYASALALMVREMGLPARVVLGFVPSAEDVAGDEPVQVTGDDVEAWVEVGFEGFGWVPFDATPPRERTPDNTDIEKPTDPQPQVVQPPPPPPGAVTPPDEDDEQPAPEPPSDDDGSAAIWRTVAIVAVSVLVPLLVLALPFVVVGLIKAVRRRRRRNRGDTVTRVAGGWAEVLDTAADLRQPVPDHATRTESAAVLAAAFVGEPSRRRPDVGAEVRELARTADRAVFAPGEPPPEQVDAYWSRVDEAVAAMRRSVGWRRRVRARLSLASVRARRHRTVPASPAGARPGRSRKDSR
ncbi:transglutaminase-like domain-containing protein [Cellulomonas sp. DKR-3]|uniref:Transglutaminase-like domain-containing protein n=1 Tax=Cellulomonas fulva TaxID=2835530 RepID=A0ABS5U056_9CELL|nr:transglutaminase-like domain-containing protein [Cellulomonas fulva]MBT0994756.1 transglutaminase-like domain-containing protein [Cellulomonas fulva]